MTALSTASPAVRSSLEWASRFGWKVFPVTAGDKKPAVKGWQALASDDPAVWAGWWSSSGSHPDCLVGVATGPASGIWVLDVDPKSGGKDSWIALGQQHGSWGSPLTARTPSGGRHQIYAYPPQNVLADFGADRVKNRTSVKPGIDVRGAGGLIVCPGAEDRPIIEQAAELGDAPGWLLELVLRVDGDVDAGGGTAGTSKLADLLDNPPHGEGGRNNWLAAVAGHLAARESYKDAYLAQVRSANRSLTPPLGPDEVEKTAESVWSTELKKAKTRGAGPLPEELQRAAAAASVESKTGRSLPTPVGDDELAEAAAALGLDTGGLRSVRRDGKRVGRLEVDVLERVGDKQVRKPAEWADFDLVATGVTRPGTGDRQYRVTLIRGRDGAKIEEVLPAGTIADRRKLNAWLFGHGCTIADPPNQSQRLEATVRLLRYIEAQGPKEFTLVRHLGYSDEAHEFIAPRGVITPTGLQPHGQYVPTPGLGDHKDATFRYGFDRSEAEARKVLNEVLTFHHADEAAVFGAWWAATLLKHVAMAHTSLFPVMAIEAPSESGKTSGMFGMLIRLSGWAGGQSTYTKASFRDALTVNRNGIIWLDDPDTVDHLEEVLRAATAEGTMTKKAEDLAHNQSAQLVAPVVVSGEHLGFRDEKALRDRAVHLSVRSPTDRKSLKPGKEHLPQWVDVSALKRRYPDLSQFAGTLVSMALRYEDEFAADVQSLGGSAGRRVGDTVAILRAGARLLGRLTGDEGFDDQVGHWLDENGIEDVGAENALTLRVLPELLAIVGSRSKPTKIGAPPQFGGMTTPVLVRPGAGGDEVWVSPLLAAMWWHRLRNGRIEHRVESSAAFTQQVKALGVGSDFSRLPVDGDTKDRPRFYRLPQEVSDRLLG